MLKKILTNKYTALLLVLSLALLTYTAKPRLLDNIALALEDNKFSLRQELNLAPQPHPDLIVVTIDEPSINQFGRWPWSRSEFARLLEKMAQARLISLDLVFSEDSNPQQDQALAETIDDNENLLLGYFLRNEATQLTTDEQLDTLEDCAYLNVQGQQKSAIREFEFAELNIPLLSRAALSCSFFTTEPDPDGLYRHYPLAFIHKGYLLPPIAVQSAQYALNQAAEITLNNQGIRSLKIGPSQVNHQNYLRLNYTQNVNTLSAADILNNKVSANYFDNKIVIIGITEIGLFDLRPTPVDAITPGVYLHYVATSNLLQNNLIFEHALINPGLLITALLLTYLVGRISSMSLRILSYLGIIIGGLGSIYLLFFTQAIWAREFYILTPVLGLAVYREMLSFFNTDLHNKEITRAFSSYVSSDVVDEILKNPQGLKLGGDEQEVTVLFSDIRNFTTLSEGLAPSDLVSLLNRLFDPMTEAILENRGMLDKYIGDAMMALYNAPLQDPLHADNACISALKLVQIQQRLNQEFVKDKLPQTAIGVGINTGVAVVGNMGSSLRFSYTAIGDAVNLSSRLEGMTKVYGCDIIISEFVAKKLTLTGKHFLIRRLDKIRVKGKNQAVVIYELMPLKESLIEMNTVFEYALDDYFEQKFIQAISRFQLLHEQFNDEASKVLMQRCEQFIQNPPTEWDGTFDQRSK